MEMGEFPKSMQLNRHSFGSLSRNKFPAMKVTFRWFLLLPAFLLVMPMNAQRTCGTDSVHAHMMGLLGYERGFLDRVEAVNAVAGNRADCDDPLIIPVAVHFQNTGIPNDCAIEMALSQVETLNQDFAGTNPDITEWNTLQPTLWPGISNAESCILFCLASMDHPAGFGLQEGDFAVTVDQTNGDSDASWSGYLNFFVRDLGGGLLGYSPLGGNGSGDGVTCGPNFFGSVSCGGNTIDGAFGMGRTITHEVGHYLLLEHPWGGGGCGSDDFVADTPVTDDAQWGCPSGQAIVNCTDNILWPSYMDYCDDACLFMFSAGQVERMEDYVTQNLQNLLNNSVTVCQEAACVDFEVSLTSIDESCGGNDASIVATAVGGAAPYQYTVNGSVQVNNGAFNSLNDGTYDLMVIDGNECDFTATIEISRDAPDLQITAITHEYCTDGAGSIAIEANEPSPFSYSINGGSSWSDEGLFAGLPAGTYTVEAQNLTGCAGEVEVVILNESDLEIDIEERRDVSCTWFDNGSIVLKASGGDEPYQYVFNGIETSTSGSFTGLAAGIHIVHVEDAVGCVYDEAFELGFDFSMLGEDCPCYVFVPNAMTPDGDMQNEVLEVKASCPISDFHIQVFDRWGFMVFESFDPEFKWHGGYNGYYVDSDVFLYRISYRWGEDVNASVKTELTTGFLTVMR